MVYMVVLFFYVEVEKKHIGAGHNNALYHLIRICHTFIIIAVTSFV